MFNYWGRVIIAALFSLLFLSCSKESIPNKYPNSLNIALPANINSLDPAVAYDTISSTIISQCYEQLYQYHYLKQTYTVVPLLAEGLPSISKDGRTYTITIKKGIRYHNNPAITDDRDVTAEDFITQIKRIAFAPTQSTGWWLLDKRIEGINIFRDQVKDDFSKMIKTSIKGVVAKDKYTLKIVLTSKQPEFLHYLTTNFLVPIPKEVAIYYQNNLAKTVVGTGPFTLSQLNPNQKTILLKNQNYHDERYPGNGDRFAIERGLQKDTGKKLPLLDSITLTVDEDVTSRTNKFLHGDYDFIQLPKDFYKQMIEEDGTLKSKYQQQKIELDKSSTQVYWWLSFNMKDPLFGNNLNLRKAIAHAIDFEAYINVCTNKTGLRANSILPPSILGYDPSTELPYLYDLKKAREFMKLAGYPDGKELPILKFPTRGLTKTGIEQANFFKDQLAKIGIRLEIVSLPFEDFLAGIREGKFPIFLGGWSLDYPSADNILQLLKSGNQPPGPNTSRYSNPKVDALIEQIGATESEVVRKELINQLQVIVNDDLPWVMLYYSRTFTLYQGFLKNFRFTDIIGNSFKYLDKEK